MTWTHIILEAYCSIDWDNNPKFLYELNISDISDEWKTKKVPNPKYDPNKPKRVKPDFCPGEPCYICYENDCPHLCTCSVDEEDYIVMMEAWNRKCENERD
jgi:hypothetical protein